MGTIVKLLLALVILLCISVLESKAQIIEDEQEVNNQLWIDLIPHFRINDNLEFYGDASFRTRDQGNRKIITIRPSLRWQVGPIFAIHGGIGIFYNFYSDFDNVPEIRPWQGVRFSFPDIGRLQFKQYIRLEQRYYPTLGALLIHRVRYQISVKIPLNKKIVQLGAIFIPLKFEWLGQADKELQILWASESRLIIGLGYVLSKDWQFEFEYMNWWTKELPEFDFQRDQQIFRVKFIRKGWIFGE